MDKIAEAEAAEAQAADIYKWREALSAMITLAKEQRDELARLKAPLGDGGIMLIARLRPLVEWQTGLTDDERRGVAAAIAYIERQAAALTKDQRDELARLTKGVEAVRREIEELHTPSYSDRRLRDVWTLGVRRCLAILAQHIPAQEAGHD